MWQNNMNTLQNCQTDLEVILEFLEEHCRQESRREDLWDNTSEFYQSPQVISQTADHFGSLHMLSSTNAQQDSVVEFGTRGSDSLNSSTVQTLNALDAAAEIPLTPLVCCEKGESTLGSTPAGRGKKLRLFRFLFEMLEDPGMAHCLSWVPASAGVFRFSSTHKERVAELWGQRKGNRRPMTYQKMSRALRNYTRSGEIIKVRKKLTYQFSRSTLTTLRNQQLMKNVPT